MIEDARGRIDYEEAGRGPTVVLVPGSCSTGAAWRPVIAAMGAGFRHVTTSLLGYGGTAERRTAQSSSIHHECEVVEAVIRRAGGPAHLVGHSYGGLVSLAVALRREAPLASLTILEAPAAEILNDCGEHEHYRAFRAMTEIYFADVKGGDAEAIRTMVDFYGGAGTFDSWPPRVRAYAIETTPVNVRDWGNAFAFPLTRAALADINIPTLVMWGAISNPAAQRANALLAKCIDGAATNTVAGAAHFMIATHADVVARLAAAHVLQATG